MDPLSRLIAIEEIRQLKARYFRHMDMRDWDAMAEVFCRDARFDCSDGATWTTLDGAVHGEAGPVTVGREPIMAWISAAFAERASCHHGHGHEVTVDSETEAHGICAMEDWIFGPDRKTLHINAAGHYHERYRHEDGAWRIADVKLTRLFVNLADTRA